MSVLRRRSLASVSPFFFAGGGGEGKEEGTKKNWMYVSDMN